MDPIALVTVLAAIALVIIAAAVAVEIWLHVGWILEDRRQRHSHTHDHSSKEDRTNAHH